MTALRVHTIDHKLQKHSLGDKLEENSFFLFAHVYTANKPQL